VVLFNSRLLFPVPYRALKALSFSPCHRVHKGFQLSQTHPDWGLSLFFRRMSFCPKPPLSLLRTSFRFFPPPDVSFPLIFSGVVHASLQWRTVLFLGSGSHVFSWDSRFSTLNSHLPQIAVGENLPNPDAYLYPFFGVDSFCLSVALLSLTPLPVHTRKSLLRYLPPDHSPGPEPQMWEERTDCLIPEPGFLWPFPPLCSAPSVCILRGWWVLFGLSFQVCFPPAFLNSDLGSHGMVSYIPILRLTTLFRPL